MYPTPTLNSTGCFTATTPFDTTVQTNKPYTVIAVRLLTDMELAGDTPLQGIYTPAGLDLAQYMEDVDQHVSVITLSGEGGELLYIPNRYLTSLPLHTGISYTSRMLTIPMGTLPVSLDLSGLITDLAGVVTSGVGVVPTIQETTTSSEIKIPYDTDTILTNLRNSLVSSSLNWEGRYLQEVLRNSMLTDLVDQYECYLVNNSCGITCASMAITSSERIPLCQSSGWGTGKATNIVIRSISGVGVCEDHRDSFPSPPPDDAEFYQDPYLLSGTSGCAGIFGAEDQFMINLNTSY